MEFIIGVIEEKFYIEHPESFEVHGRESHVCRLKRELYGLNKEPHAWYSMIDSFFLGFTKSDFGSKLYDILVRGEPLIPVLHIFDLLIIGSENPIAYCNRDLTLEFDMNYLGLMHYFIGLEVWQRYGNIFLGQGNYSMEILKRFRM